MPDVIEWRRCADGDAVRRAAQALTEGRLVVFPTETVYGVAASVYSPEGMSRLTRSKGRPDEKPFSIAIPNPESAFDWLPQLGRVGQRLAQRCWPGPLTLVSGEGLHHSAARELPEPIKQKICPFETIGLRVPAHAAILRVLAEMSGALALSSANRSGEPDSTTAEAAVAAIGEQVEFVISDGPSRFGKPSTVVRVDGDRWRILREGCISADSIRRLAARTFVFVCTGNTCRSPIAAALFKKMMADRIGCPLNELLSHGILVQSAGLATVTGMPAANEAMEIAKEHGADLSEHVSQPLTSELATFADYLFVMTSGHLAALAERYDQRGTASRLLCQDGTDIPDPIGADRETYRQCARQIQLCLEKWLPEVETQ